VPDDTLRGGSEAQPAELPQYAQNYLADYKVPEKFFFLPEIPKSLTGKVNRRALKEMLVSASVASA
jgi:long-chain acyl-CoA synthetase